MELLNSIKEFFVEIGIPPQVIIAIVSVIFVTEVTKNLLTILENYLEEKKGKQIVIFNHTKIILVVIWSIIASIILAASNIIGWHDVLLYLFVLTGFSSFLYDIIIKKFKNKDE